MHFNALASVLEASFKLENLDFLDFVFQCSNIDTKESNIFSFFKRYGFNIP